MKPSDVIKALEEGKRVGNTKWPEGHYWEMKLTGTVKSVGGGKISKPDYTINDLFEFGGEWFIVPKYVPFSEAMKAVEDGKTAICYFNKEVITIVSHNNKINSICKSNACSSGGGASILIAWIVAGKWVVEEDVSK